MTFTLAHFSDPHLGPLPRARLRDLASKRALGFANWHRGRGARHSVAALAAILLDLKEQKSDHIALTGDLVNIALADEFSRAASWLGEVGSPHDVTLVPGNHDAYVRAMAAHPARHWGAYMRGDEDGGAPNGAPLAFPFVRRRGPVALIGMSSAVPTAPFLATGFVGADQLARLAQLLDTLGREQLFRVVLIHHPPTPTAAGRFKRLVDSRALRAVLERHGAELLLHGHDHVHSLIWLDGPDRRIPAIGVPSASMLGDAKHGPAAYNIYRIDGRSRDWSVEMIWRGLRQGGAEVVETGREMLTLS